jgi:hypothetical protein
LIFLLFSILGVEFRDSKDCFSALKHSVLLEKTLSKTLIVGLLMSPELGLFRAAFIVKFIALGYHFAKKFLNPSIISPDCQKIIALPVLNSLTCQKNFSLLTRLSVLSSARAFCILRSVELINLSFAETRPCPFSIHFLSKPTS